MLSLRLHILSNRLFFCLFIAVFCQSLHSVFAQSGPPDWKPDNLWINSWDVGNGLPVNSVNHIHQDAKGYIWLATYDGLARFDGVRFQVYQSQSDTSITTNRFNKIFESADGTLWFQTETRHLLQYQNNQFKRLTAEDGLGTDHINTIFSDSEKNLWFGTDSGIAVYKDGKLSPYQPDDIRIPVSQVFAETSGAVWYKCDDTNTMFRYQAGTVKTIAAISPNISYTPLHETRDGRVWLGLLNELFHFKNGIQNQHIIRLDHEDQVLNIQSDKDDNIWIKTIINGYRIISNDELEPIQNQTVTDPQYSPFLVKGNDGALWHIVPNKLFRNHQLIFEADTHFMSFFLDRENSIWLGTINQGIYQIRNNPIKTVSREQGLPNINIYPVLEASDGTIWSGTFGDGLVQIRDGVVAGQAQFEWEATSQYSLSLAELSDNSIAAGFYTGGILYAPQPGTYFYRMDTPERLSIATVYAIKEDKKGRLWSGSNEGLYMRVNDEWFRMNDLHEIPDAPVRFILQAPDESIWFATNGAGIFQYQNGEFTVYDSAESLSSNLVRSLHISDVNTAFNYHLWVGYEDNGLDRFHVENSALKAGSVTQYRVHNGLFDNVIHRILEDGYGYYWMSTNRGIFRVLKSELDAFMRGEISSYSHQAWTQANGMKNSEANGGMQPAGIITKDGILWFPTQDGLAVINPSLLVSESSQPPITVIENIATDNHVYNLPGEDDIRLPKGKRDFSIEFTSLSFINPSNLYFRYRLYPYDDWQESKLRRVNYTNLPPGEYEFQVLSAGNGTPMDENTIQAATAISIPHHFYEQTWFHIFMGGIVILLFLAGIQYRTKRLIREEARLKKLINERTSDLILEKEKSQTLAHDLARINDAKDRFITNISHELRTPLSLILGPLNQVLSSNKTQLPGEVKHKLELILRNSRRLERLTNQLTDLTKLEHGELVLNPQKINLSEFSKEICELYQPICDDKGLKLTFESDTREAWISGNRDMLEKIIGNLLSNAIKFTPADGNIVLKVEPCENGVLLSVSDEGIGISEEDLESIFERFFQARGGLNRHAEGMGVGLALVRELVELHGGTITVTSQPGRGSRFMVEFPLPDAATMQVEQNQQPDNVAFSTTENSIYSFSTAPDEPEAVESDDTTDAASDKTTLLVVEDHPDMRSYIAGIVSEKYRVLRAANGKEGLEVCKKTIPDLILADIMMPGMDGVAFNKELKKNSEWATIPVVFLTARVGEEHLIEALNDGADDYIVKPFNAEHLLARINNLLETRFRLKKLLEKQKLKPNGEQGEPNDSFLRNVNTILEDHYTDPDFSVHDFSKKLFLDRTHFYRKLKARSGSTPQEYMKQFRLNRACSLIKNREGTISEIAYGVGFRSLAYFSKCFKEAYGCTPSEKMESQKSQ